MKGLKKGLKQNVSPPLPLPEKAYHCPCPLGQQCLPGYPKRRQSPPQFITLQRRRVCGTDHMKRENTESQVICVLDTPLVDPGRKRPVLPAPPSMRLHGHSPSNPVPSPPSGGLLPGKAEESRNISSLEELRQTHPQWCRHCSQQGQSFINYSGTVQLCKSVGSLCLTAAFPRTPVEDGMSRVQPARCQEGAI